jgi:hypothetical protein
MGFCLLAIVLINVLFTFRYQSYADPEPLPLLVWLGLVAALLGLAYMLATPRPDGTVTSILLGGILLAEIVPLSWALALAILDSKCLEEGGFVARTFSQCPGVFVGALGAQGLAQVIQLVVAVGVVARRRMALRAAIAVQLLLIAGTATLLVPYVFSRAVVLVLVVIFLGLVVGNSAVRNTVRDSADGVAGGT